MTLVTEANSLGQSAKLQISVQPNHNKVAWWFLKLSDTNASKLQCPDKGRAGPK